jgi:Family of unknown function (DUF5691)
MHTSGRHSCSASRGSRWHRRRRSLRCCRREASRPSRCSPSPDSASASPGRRQWRPIPFPALHADPRPILPPDARRALNRLAGSVEKSLAGNVLPAALRRIAAAGCRPHPFDLPELARHIKADAENLGVAERAYLALIASDADEDAARGLFFDRITAENWITFPKTQRRTFVAGMRRDDPAAGRALIESVWKTEPAPVRAALLEALAVGLGLDDKPFLERLTTDRADSVRQAAQRLLARMPGTEGFAPRAAEAAKCFTRKAGGIGRVLAALAGGGGTLTFAPPGGLLTYVQVDQLFSGLSLNALAEAAGVTPAEIVAALPAFEVHILRCLIETAAADGDSASLQCILMGDLRTSRPLTGADVQPFAAAGLVLDADGAARFLAAPAWKNAVTELAGMARAPKDDGRLLFTATLMPREAMRAFVASLDAAPLAAARAARDFADLILALPDSLQPLPGASS